MTPKFITPCFIRKNTPEIRQKLNEAGYRSINLGGDYRDCIITMPKGYNEQMIDSFPCYVTSGIEFINKYFSNREDIVDCGENVALFLDLSGMREDTDRDQ